LIRRILAYFRRPRVEPSYPCISQDVLIARRAMRLHNRNPERAARFERVHTILARGKKHD
jgi:hypothetical protein